MLSKNPAASPETILVTPKYRFLPIKPDGDGCIPLSAALHWIASKGLVGAPEACPDARDQYQAAAKEFSDKVISGKVRVIGADHNQRPETLSPEEFAIVRRWSFFFNGDADFFSDATTDDLRIVIVPCGDDQRSEDQFWGAGNQPRLTMLQVFREDIRREWPFKCFGQVVERQEIEALPNARESEAPLILLSEREPKGGASKAAWYGLRFRWPNGVPSDTPLTVAHSAVNAWIKKQPRNVIERNEVSRMTVARLLGRKK